MNRFTYLIILVLLFACSKEDRIPAICDTMGYDEEAIFFEEDFCAKSIYNGEKAEFDAGYFGYRHENDQPVGSIGLVRYNECNLLDFQLELHELKISFDKQIIDSTSAYFHYGAFEEVVTSSRYDSLIVTPDFENFIRFDYISLDSSVVEGHFQIKLTRRWCNYTSDGKLQRCEQPVFDYNEPETIVIKDAKFRL
ncbi:hypothetical protein [Portibacter marinus]|uniref:hypothetical protein n=1 Tax=Portibacter marinus TaxID=2898660 RepID=UPI001F2D7EBE|nr:hypothetical protein [Portibacter marinus]